MSKGWIYLKKDVNTDGTARGYKFGLTNSNKRRSREYRTENPGIVHIESYETDWMDAAEFDLAHKVEAAGMRLYPNSDEWVKPECFDEFMVMWEEVKARYHIDAPSLTESREAFMDASDESSPDTGAVVAVASFVGHVLYYATIAGGLILLFYAVKYFIAVIAVVVIAAACWGLLMDAGKPKRRRRRAW
jgi:hypothetical protein